MTNKLSIRRFAASLATTVLMLASAMASAQTPPPDQPPPPPPPEVAPPPPPPEVQTPPAPAPPIAPAVQYPHMGPGNTVVIAPDTWFKVGLQAQIWAQAVQSSAKTADGSNGGFSYDLIARRLRILVAAQVTKNINAFFETDMPNTGLGTKGGTAESPTPAKVNFPGGPTYIQDAFFELKLAGDAFMMEAGLFVVPISHHELQTTSAYLGLNLGNVAAQFIGPTATSVTRDTGFQFKGYELDDKLEWRLGVFQGIRQLASGSDPISANAPLIAGKIQYDFFDAEKGYVYPGYTYGKAKILGVSAGFETQKLNGFDSTYYTLNVGAWTRYPLSGEKNKAGGDEIDANVEFFHYNGGTNPTTETGVGVANQNDFLINAAYYNRDLSASVYGKFEMKKLADDVNKAQNTNWIEFGVKYFVHETTCNFALDYQRTMFPDADTTKVNDVNAFTLQAQFFFF